MNKQKAGRPLMFPGGARRVYVTQDDATQAKAREIGQGNLSAGIRVAVGAFKARIRKAEALDGK